MKKKLTFYYIILLVSFNLKSNNNDISKYILIVHKNMVSFLDSRNLNLRFRESFADNIVDVKVTSKKHIIVATKKSVHLIEIETGNILTSQSYNDISKVIIV